MSRVRSVSVVGLALVLGLVACSGSDASQSDNASSGAQDWHTETLARAFSGEKRLAVDVEYGAGELKVSPGPASTLYRATLRYDADNFTPRSRYSDGVLRLGLEGGHVHFNKGERQGNRLDLALGPSVPLDLTLKFGAVDANLDLGGLRITNAHISTGASQTKLRVSQPNPASCDALALEIGAASFEATDLGNLGCSRLSLTGGVGDITLGFGGQWKSDMAGDIQMGLGSLKLVVPRGTGLRLVKDGVLSSIDGAGLVKRGNTYTTEGFDAASHHLTLHVQAALGSIDVAWKD